MTGQTISHYRILEKLGEGLCRFPFRVQRLFGRNGRVTDSDPARRPGFPTTP